MFFTSLKTKLFSTLLDSISKVLIKSRFTNNYIYSCEIKRLFFDDSSFFQKNQWKSQRLYKIRFLFSFDVRADGQEIVGVSNHFDFTNQR